jgi:hypothetical protein
MSIFKSKSGNLNLFSYLIISALFSIIISLLCYSLLELYKERQIKIKKLADKTSWIYSDKIPEIINNVRYLNEFSSELVEKIKQEISNPTNENLQKVKVIKAADFSRNTDFRLFGINSIVVDPTKITYSKKENRDLTENELRVFNSFGVFLSEITPTRFSFKSDSLHVERFLPKLLNQEGKTDDTEFVIPWIYIASRAGAIALLPGSDVINEKEWDATARPWYRASLGYETRLASGPVFRDDQLTATYLDVLAKRPILVRTYLYEFSIKDENFVVGIDLHIPFNSESLLGSENLDYYEFLTSSFKNINDLTILHYVFFGIALLILIGLRKVTLIQATSISFIKKEHLYGNLNTTQVYNLDQSRSESDTTASRVGLNFWPFSITRSRDISNENNIKDTLQIIAKNSFRGFELWIVTLNVKTIWHVFWIRFENFEIRRLGQARLFYTRDVLPIAQWKSFTQNLESIDNLGNVRARILKIISRNADFAKDNFDLSLDSLDNIVSNVPKIPQELRGAVESPDHFFSVRQLRLYVKLTTDQLNRLYSNARLKAVMTSGYFEQILNEDQTEFLSTGVTINRIIVFKNEKDQLNLNDKGKESLTDLENSYTGNSRSLRRANGVMDDNSLIPVYDFAVLNDVYVFVAHFISQSNVYDTATGKAGKVNYSIEGYLSWRYSDVAFYKDLFDQMVNGSSPYFGK